MTIPAPRPIAQAQPDRGAGWLSDLLAAASREEKPVIPAIRPSSALTPVNPSPVVAPTQPPAGQTQPLTGQVQPSSGQMQPLAGQLMDPMSLDIARMVDGGALADAWDRYRHGEAHAFTRRIYTIPGQSTYDEIRRRYRASPEFRTTIDRYTQEFERLLEGVGRDDRDGSLTRNYLISDTGKVYAMLAHAAGRFD